MNEIGTLQYPLGRFCFDPKTSMELREQLVTEYGLLPEKLEAAVESLTDQQLDTPYRPGGWTVRQVVHHLPESHMNAYVRLKLALTEENHKAVVADEAAWAERKDSRNGHIALSLELFRVLQQRWVLALRAFSEADFERTMWHPAWGTVSLDYVVQNYAWHARHHIAQITRLRERMRWT